MSGFISYKKVLKHWKMSEYEFVERFLRRGIIPYNQNGEAVSPQEIIYDSEDARDEIKKICDWRNVKTPESDSESNKMFSKFQSLYFDANNIQSFEKEYKLKKDRKLRHDQRCRLLCRNIAQQFWEEDPTITIADMIKKKEIIENSKRTDQKLFSEDTRRNWIKDLCPNRAQGRRAKKAEK